VPANPRSLAITDVYRRRLLAIGDRVGVAARQAWPRIEELDSTPWADHMASELTRAQIQAVRLTAGYLGAFLRSETGRGTAPAIDSRKYAGLSTDGRPLGKALESPLIAVRAALKDGRAPAVALSIGLTRALRTVPFEAVQAGRDALRDTIEADERFSGAQRSVAGTCAACMALSGEPRYEVHPGCQCVFMPVVAGVAATIAIPTGAELFRSLSTRDQEKAIGAEPARLVRDGEADLKDFIDHSPQERRPDLLTQKPVEAVTT
jgi:hypothetical protein